MRRDGRRKPWRTPTLLVGGGEVTEEDPELVESSEEEEARLQAHIVREARAILFGREEGEAEAEAGTRAGAEVEGSKADDAGSGRPKKKPSLPVKDEEVQPTGGCWLCKLGPGVCKLKLCPDRSENCWLCKLGGCGLHPGGGRLYEAAAARAAAAAAARGGHGERSTAQSSREPWSGQGGPRTQEQGRQSLLQCQQRERERAWGQS